MEFINTIQISFYEEVSSVRCPAIFSGFKELIAEKYFLNPLDVDELIIYYVNEKSEKVAISNELEFQRAVKSALNLKIYIEVSEKSKLYLREFEASKVICLDHLNEKNVEVEKINSLKKEIEVKERLLKEMIDKERLEREKKEKERLESERCEKEKATLVEDLTKIVTATVTKNLEQFKVKFIKKTICETLKTLQNQIEPIKTVHHGVKCDLCEVFPIVGVRYKCTVCDNFDLCEKCEGTDQSHDHPMIKYRVPAKKNAKKCKRPVKPKPVIVPVYVDYEAKIKKMKAELNLGSISDEKILNALYETKGEVDAALALLFK